MKLGSLYSKKSMFWGYLSLSLSLSVPKMKMRTRNWKNSHKNIFDIKYEIVGLYGAQCSRVH